MAGGFMSGFGPAFGNAFTSTVDRAQKAYDDEVKTKMAFALEQKTAFEKAKAADTALVKQAEAIAANVPGAPDEAWKVAYSQLKAGFAEKDIRDEMRKGSWTAIQTPEKGPAVETPEAKTASETAVEGSVEAQMQEAVGEPAKAPETAASVSEEPTEAPKEEDKGMFSNLRQSIKEGHEKRVNDETLSRIGVDEAQYDEWLTGYQSDVDIEMKGYKFNIPKDTGDEAKNFSQALYQMAITDPAYVEAEKKGDRATMKSILDRYAKQGETTASTYDWKGTKASLLDIKDDAERNATSPDPSISGPAKQFLSVRLPQILSQNPDILDDTASTTDPEERLGMAIESLLKAKEKLKTVSPEELPKLQAEIATLESEVSIGKRSVQYLDRLGDKPSKRQVWVRDEAAGQDRLIEATIVPDYNAPNGERLTDGAGNPISFLRDASEQDKTIISGFKAVSDETVKYNTETVANASSALLTGKRISDSLRGEYGMSLINATGGLSNIYEAAVNNIKVLGQEVGVVYEGDGTSPKVTADQFAQRYGYGTLKEMAVARDNFEANAAVLVYQLASALFDQTGRGLSDTDLIKTGEAIGVENFNDPVALADRIDQLMVDHMDKINMAGRNIMALPQVQAYQKLMGMEEVPMEARTRSIQEVAAQNPGTAASMAVEYYDGIAKQIRERNLKPKEEKPKVDSKTVYPLTNEVVEGMRRVNPQVAARFQDLLDNGATGYRLTATGPVPANYEAK